jgi:hypothetical protein
MSKGPVVSSPSFPDAKLMSAGARGRYQFGYEDLAAPARSTIFRRISHQLFDRDFPESSPASERSAQNPASPLVFSVQPGAAPILRRQSGTEISQEKVT